MLKIIDVSKWNGAIDWKKVKASGVDGVIIRAGYGKSITQKDQSFEGYYAGAVAAGLHVGTYWFSYAQNPAESAVEAAVFTSAIKGKKFDLPVYLDIEDASQANLGKTVCDAMVNAFCSLLEKAKYFAGVYSYDSFFGSSLSSAITSRFSAWVARVENVKPVHCKQYGMWQNSWKGKIPGINGDVDCNICYKDFPAIIKKAKLNGYGG